jgi:methylthioribulose-1-phosphate dehydratase
MCCKSIADAKVIQGIGRPSAETKLHLAVVRTRGAASVLHTHSVWSTIISDSHAADGGLTISGYEMLKGLQEVGTHEHDEWIPSLRILRISMRSCPELRKS